MDFNFYIITYFVIWTSGLLIYFKVRSMMKKLYPSLHSEIFGKSWQDHSIKTSTNWASFSMRPSKWSQISDPSLLFWLKASFIDGVLFYGYGLVFLIYFIFLGIELSLQ